MLLHQKENKLINISIKIRVVSIGQQLNREETSLFFSRNTPPDTQESIKQLFGVEVIKQYEKYLGLPSLVGRSHWNMFTKLKERLANKLSGWKETIIQCRQRNTH